MVYRSAPQVSRNGRGNLILDNSYMMGVAGATNVASRGTRTPKRAHTAVACRRRAWSDVVDRVGQAGVIDAGCLTRLRPGQVPEVTRLEFGAFGLSEVGGGRVEARGDSVG